MCPIKNLCKGNATLICMQYFNDGYLIKPKGDQSTIGRFQSWYYSTIAYTVSEFTPRSYWVKFTES